MEYLSNTDNVDVLTRSCAAIDLMTGLIYRASPKINIYRKVDEHGTTYYELGERLEDCDWRYTRYDHLDVVLDTARDILTASLRQFGPMPAPAQKSNPAKLPLGPYHS